MAKSEQRIEARRLRQQGLSIIQISRKIEIAKSTVSKWCQDITLTPEQIEELDKWQSRVRYKTILEIAKRKHDKRQSEIMFLRKAGVKKLRGKLSVRELTILGTALYWGEGMKSRKFGLINSDPRILKIFILWLNKVLDIERSQLSLTIRLNSQHSYRADQVKDYWSESLGIPTVQFTKTLFINTMHKKKYENDETYFGTVTIRITKGVDYLHQILGLMDGIAGKLQV